MWGDTFVTDDVLTRCISELRKALEDDAKEPRVIQTIPKRGYRLLVKVESVKPLSPVRPISPINRYRHSGGGRRWCTRDDAVDGQPHCGTSHREHQTTYVHR